MSEWRGSPALREMLVPIDRLVPFERNPRVGDVTAVAASLERFGQLKPVVVDGDRIVAGHHVVQAARERLGWEQIAVAANDFGGEAEQRAFLLADNRTSELGFTDQTLLAEHLRLLAEQDMLDGTGYDGDDLDDLLADLQRQTRADGDADAVPSLPAEPSSRRGEVYELGRHRLMCGDATDEDQVRHLFDDPTLMFKVEVLWTDPPYGVEYVGKTPKALTITNDHEDGLLPLLVGAFRQADQALAPSARFYVAAPAGPRHRTFLEAVDEVGWVIHQTLIWVKNSLVLGHADYHYRHEPILYGWKPGEGRAGRGKHPGSRWYGDNSQDTVFEVDRPTRSEEHPTMKPVELIERQLRNSSQRGDAVYDPFAGSGSTLIACERSGRVAYLMELDRSYCDVIRSRYETFVTAGDFVDAA